MKYRQIIFTLITLVLVLLATELLFRGFLRMTGRQVILVLPSHEVLKKAWFKPHPNLVYVFKSDTTFTMNSPGHPRFTINHFGFRSTLQYDVHAIQKPENTIRVATLGGSTTMGVNDDDKIWPYLLGVRLSTAIPERRIEVLNEGTQGYTSLDNLLDLSVRVIDFDCDVYVLYLGVNDLLAAAPLSIYRSDFSHFRSTIYESLYDSPSNRIPGWLLKSVMVRAILQRSGCPDSRSLMDNTATKQFRKGYKIPIQEQPEVDEKVRSTMERNIRSMIGVIRVHNPAALIVLPSFYDLYNRPVIIGMNEDMERVAGEQGALFVDAARGIPRDSSMVYDYGHFTVKGDSAMAEFLANAIVRRMESDRARGGSAGRPLPVPEDSRPVSLPSRGGR